jgi:hypothetical protein
MDNSSKPSRCPKCEGSKFEKTATNLDDESPGYLFVRCASCQTVVGVVETYNVARRINLLIHALGKQDEVSKLNKVDKLDEDHGSSL